MKAPKFKWTKEAEEYVLQNYKGVGPTEMAERVQKLFGLPANRNNLKHFYAGHHLDSGLTGRFEKGHKAPNKGKKVSAERYAKSEPTMFKEGHEPVNKTPIGTVRCRPGADGYLFRKVGPRSNEWVMEQRWQWEQHHGPIPKGYVIAFLDGDKTNCSIDNLVLISRAVNARRNQMHMTYNDAEMNKAAITCAELITTIHKRKRGE